MLRYICRSRIQGHYSEDTGMIQPDKEKFSHYSEGYTGFLFILFGTYLKLTEDINRSGKID